MRPFLASLLLAMPIHYIDQTRLLVSGAKDGSITLKAIKGWTATSTLLTHGHLLQQPTPLRLFY